MSAHEIALLVILAIVALAGPWPVDLIAAILLIVYAAVKLFG